MVTLFDLGETIESLAKSVGKLADSTEKWAAFARRVFTSVSARQAQKRLTSYLVRSIDIRMRQTGAIDQMEAYLLEYKFLIETLGEEGEPSEDTKAYHQEMWKRIIDSFGELDDLIAGLCEDLRLEKGRFAAFEGYEDLYMAMGNRKILIGKLRDTEPPSSAADVRILEVILDKYAKLRRELRATNDSLRSYLRSPSIYKKTRHPNAQDAWDKAKRQETKEKKGTGGRKRATTTPHTI